MSIKIVVISLAHRHDRRKETIDGMQNNNLDFVFLDATDISKYNSIFSTNFSSSKHAIWHSHVLVYEKLLLSEDNWIAVLEDDISYDRSNLLSIENLQKCSNALRAINSNLCMVQFGFNFEPGTSFRQFYSDIFYSIFRFRRYDFKDLNRLRHDLGSLNLFRLSKGLSREKAFSFVVKGHQRGTHYYLINRKLAVLAIEYFYQNFANLEIPPIDIFFSQIAQEAADFLIVRPSLPFAHQSTSESDNKY